MDAERRALPWLGGHLAETARASSPAGVGDRAWTVWAGHHAHLTVGLRAEHDTHPEDTSTEAVRQYAVTQTPVGADRWRGRPIHTLVLVRLTRTAAGWALTDLREEH